MHWARVEMFYFVVFSWILYVVQSNVTPRCYSPIDIIPGQVKGPATIPFPEEVRKINVTVKRRLFARENVLVLQLQPVNNLEHSKFLDLLTANLTDVSNSTSATNLSASSPAASAESRNTSIIVSSVSAVSNSISTSSDSSVFNNTLIAKFNIPNIDYTSTENTTAPAAFGSNDLCMGGDPYCYLYSEIRWGSDNKTGSDHSVGGERSSLEIQHYFRNIIHDLLAISVRYRIVQQNKTADGINAESTLHSNLSANSIQNQAGAVKRDASVTGMMREKVAVGLLEKLTSLPHDDKIGDSVVEDMTSFKMKVIQNIELPEINSPEASPRSFNGDSASSEAADPNEAHSSANHSVTESSHLTRHSAEESKSATTNQTIFATSTDSYNNLNFEATLTPAKSTKSMSNEHAFEKSLHAKSDGLEAFHLLLTGVLNETNIVLGDFLLPSDKGYYQYRGNMPGKCEVKVKWLVYEEEAEVSPSLLRSLRDLPDPSNTFTIHQTHFRQRSEPMEVLKWPYIASNDSLLSMTNNETTADSLVATTNNETTADSLVATTNNETSAISVGSQKQFFSPIVFITIPIIVFIAFFFL